MESSKWGGGGEGGGGSCLLPVHLPASFPFSQAPTGHDPADPSDQEL